MTLKDCVKFLTDNGYLFGMNNLPYLSRKFYKEVVDKDIGLDIVERRQTEVIESMMKPKQLVVLPDGKLTDVKAVAWSSLYSKFILEADIPRLAYSGKGDRYQLNLNTKKGVEAFKAALIEGESYDSLVDKARLYYKSTQMPVKVENFFVNEIWRNEFTDDRDNFATGGALG